MLYHKAMDHVDILFDMTPEQKKQSESALTSIALNYAQCCIKDMEYDRAIELCDKALKSTQNNQQRSKALYRKGLVCHRKGDLDRADSYLSEAAVLCGNDPAIISGMRILPTCTIY